MKWNTWIKAWRRNVGGNRNRDRLVRYINECMLKIYQKLMKLLKESKKENVKNDQKRIQIVEERTKNEKMIRRKNIME